MPLTAAGGLTVLEEFSRQYRGKRFYNVYPSTDPKRTSINICPITGKPDQTIWFEGLI